jgi:plasmid stability protein
MFPKHVADALQNRARLSHRSLGAELLAIIEEAVRPKRVTPRELLARARTPSEDTLRFRLDRQSDA